MFVIGQYNYRFSTNWLACKTLFVGIPVECSSQKIAWYLNGYFICNKNPVCETAY